MSNHPHTVPSCSNFESTESNPCHSEAANSRPGQSYLAPHYLSSSPSNRVLRSMSPFPSFRPITPPGTAMSRDNMGPDYLTCRPLESRSVNQPSVLTQQQDTTRYTPSYDRPESARRPSHRSMMTNIPLPKAEAERPSYNLEALVEQYGSSPDLLQLILSSKVEEDKRRAEEAKLRSKEIDYMLKWRPSSPHPGFASSALDSSYSLPASRRETDYFSSRAIDEQSCAGQRSPQSYYSSSAPVEFTLLEHRCMNEVPSNRHTLQPKADHYTTTSRREPSSFGELGHVEPDRQRLRDKNPRTSCPTSLHEHAPLRSKETGAPTNSESYPPTTSVSLPSILFAKPPAHITRNNYYRDGSGSFECSSEASSDMQVDTFSDNGTRSDNFSRVSSESEVETVLNQKAKHISLEDNSSPAGEPVEQRQKSPSIFRNTFHHQPSRTTETMASASSSSSSYSYAADLYPNNARTTTSPKLPIPPKHQTASSSESTSKAMARKKRKRREMQAVTMIIETREFPYNDEYLWKNNGNTVHKKTGYRSIYYKCTNSHKGCPVNKTVTFKDQGEYLIKYRGEHLNECNRVKHIKDI